MHRCHPTRRDFLYGLGFRMVLVPMEEGSRLSHNLPHHGPKRS